ncbi:hypothetical protein ACJX0J_008522 [Zea mays]
MEMELYNCFPEVFSDSYSHFLKVFSIPFGQNSFLVDFNAIYIQGSTALCFLKVDPNSVTYNLLPLDESLNSLYKNIAALSVNNIQGALGSLRKLEICPYAKIRQWLIFLFKILFPLQLIIFHYRVSVFGM